MHCILIVKRKIVIDQQISMIISQENFITKYKRKLKFIFSEKATKADKDFDP